jgi:endonuclease IV
MNDLFYKNFLDTLTLIHNDVEETHTKREVHSAYIIDSIKLHVKEKLITSFYRLRWLCQLCQNEGFLNEDDVIEILGENA